VAFGNTSKEIQLSPTGAARLEGVPVLGSGGWSRNRGLPRAGAYYDGHDRVVIFTDEQPVACFPHGVSLPQVPVGESY
jgi:hypothetical protein